MNLSGYTEDIRNASAFVKLLGVSIEKLENGYCCSNLNIQDNFLNTLKIVHGGVIYSLADISMGAAVYSTLKKGDKAATIEIKINYLKPAKTKMLTCDARVIQKGQNIAVLDAEIKDEKTIIAKALGTYSILNK